MPNAHFDVLKYELKALILKECDKEEFSPEDIDDDAPLFGSDAPLQLDSMDALQISMALKEKYGVEITDSKKIRSIMSSITTLTHFIEAR
ncbi:phosphopantetheine-binding protein [Sulfurospirillum deleyianum]|uniref:Acyl carrier protein n=1 Tax=Sulfurospirillum deleyianum (strain ATCC 51133 / DSM 6946 / 5175) TaxID=525898 RepID=D1B4V1_SULD5|nr:phosphopantetheine-binding protein [Sulfurospirillum deleyianum]ACZ13121.1 acyl carrier protein [Sulfurospirillum deleyianum DSM 6946]